MPAARRVPAQVLGHQARLITLDQALELVQMRGAQWIDRSEAQPDAMQAQRIMRAQPLEEPVRLPGLAEEILAVHLEPADRRPGVQQLAVMRRAQPDARRARHGVAMRAGRSRGHASTWSPPCRPRSCRMCPW